MKIPRGSSPPGAWTAGGFCGFLITGPLCPGHDTMRTTALPVPRLGAPSPSPAPTPARGPRILFFSGGTALRGLSRRLIRHTHNSVHLVTPFDSGGSSAALRQAFAMPAPGDLRNRLMALAEGAPDVIELFATRLPKGADPAGLDAELTELAAGTHPLAARVPEPLGGVVRHYLGVFMERMPRGFDLRGASVGNLILTAGYLEADRSFGPVVFTFSHLAGVRGTVLPTVEADLHLAAELADGSEIVGQHLLTGKQAPPLRSPIRRLRLVADLQGRPAPPCAIDATVRRLIAGAELIVLPMGSFYTSIMANLLPGGVGRAVAANPCPKVFVPNLGHDPEALGLTSTAQALLLDDALRADLPPGARARTLDFVLAAPEHGVDPGPLAARGIAVCPAELVTPASAPLIDDALLADALLRLAAPGP